MFWIQAPAALVLGPLLFLMIPMSQKQGSLKEQSILQRLARVDYMGALTLVRLSHRCPKLTDPIDRFRCPPARESGITDHSHLATSCLLGGFHGVHLDRIALDTRTCHSDSTPTDTQCIVDLHLGSWSDDGSLVRSVFHACLCHGRPWMVSCISWTDSSPHKCWVWLGGITCRLVTHSQKFQLLRVSVLGQTCMPYLIMITARVSLCLSSLH